MFLKIAAVAIYSGDFLNIFLRFWGLLSVLTKKRNDLKQPETTQKLLEIT